MQAIALQRATPRCSSSPRVNTPRYKPAESCLLVPLNVNTALPTGPTQTVKSNLDAQTLKSNQNNIGR